MEESEPEEEKPKVRPGRKLLGVRKSALREREESEEESDEPARPKKKKKVMMTEEVVEGDSQFYKQAVSNMLEHRKARQEGKVEVGELSVETGGDAEGAA